MAQKFMLLNLTSPVSGQEDEYNEWYDTQQIDDMLDVPGIISAKRYQLAEAQASKPPFPFSYLAIYEIETDDLSGVVAAIKERAGSGLMPISPALSPERLGLIFQAMQS